MLHIWHFFIVNNGITLEILECPFILINNWFFKNFDQFSNGLRLRKDLILGDKFEEVVARLEFTS